MHLFTAKSRSVTAGVLPKILLPLLSVAAAFVFCPLKLSAEGSGDLLRTSRMNYAAVHSTALAEGGEYTDTTHDGEMARWSFMTFGYDSSDQFGGVSQQQKFKFYAYEGETVFIGSSSVNVANGHDVRITYPNGTQHYFDLSDGNGYIKDATQEIKGPNGVFAAKLNAEGEQEGNQADKTTEGYNAFRLDIEQSGVYIVEFVGDGTSTTSEDTNARMDTAFVGNKGQGGNAVKNWILSMDITVCKKSGEDYNAVSGRVWMDAFGIQTSLRVYGYLYTTTRDGYIWRYAFNGIQPYTFSMYANQRGGISTATNASAYHSVHVPLTNYTSFDVYGNLTDKNGNPDGIMIFGPDNDTTDIDAPDHMFFNYPAQDLPTSILPKIDDNTKVGTIKSIRYDGRDATTVQEVTDDGITGESDPSVYGANDPGSVGVGGYFEVETEGATSYRVIIDMSNMYARYYHGETGNEIGYTGHEISKDHDEEICLSSPWKDSENGKHINFIYWLESEDPDIRGWYNIYSKVLEPGKDNEYDMHPTNSIKENSGDDLGSTITELVGYEKLSTEAVSALGLPVSIERGSEGIFPETVGSSFKSLGRIMLGNAAVDGIVDRLYWNGRDQYGRILPVGSYFGPVDPVSENDKGGRGRVYAQAKAGEVHFPMSDVENMVSGVAVKLMNADSVVESVKDGLGYKYSAGDKETAVRTSLYYNNLDKSLMRDFYVEMPKINGHARNGNNAWYWNLPSNCCNGESGEGNWNDDGSKGSDVNDSTAMNKNNPKLNEAWRTKGAQFDDYSVNGILSTESASNKAVKFDNVAALQGAGYVVNGNGNGCDHGVVDVWTHILSGSVTDLSTPLYLYHYADEKIITGFVFLDTPEKNTEEGKYDSMTNDRCIQGAIVVAEYGSEDYKDKPENEGRGSGEKRWVRYEAVTNTNGYYSIPVDLAAFGTEAETNEYADCYVTITVYYNDNVEAAVTHRVTTVKKDGKQWFAANPKDTSTTEGNLQSNVSQQKVNVAAREQDKREHTIFLKEVYAQQVGYISDTSNTSLNIVKYWKPDYLKSSTLKASFTIVGIKEEARTKASEYFVGGKSLTVNFFDEDTNKIVAVEYKTYEEYASTGVDVESDAIGGGTKHYGARIDGEYLRIEDDPAFPDANTLISLKSAVDEYNAAVDRKIASKEKKSDGSTLYVESDKLNFKNILYTGAGSLTCDPNDAAALQKVKNIYPVGNANVLYVIEDAVTDEALGGKYVNTVLPAETYKASSTSTYAKQDDIIYRVYENQMSSSDIDTGFALEHKTSVAEDEWDFTNILTTTDYTLTVFYDKNADGVYNADDGDELIDEEFAGEGNIAKIRLVKLGDGSVSEEDKLFYIDPDLKYENAVGDYESSPDYREWVTENDKNPETEGIIESELNKTDIKSLSNGTFSIKGLVPGAYRLYVSYKTTKDFNTVTHSGDGDDFGSGKVEVVTYSEGLREMHIVPDENEELLVIQEFTIGNESEYSSTVGLGFSSTVDLSKAFDISKIFNISRAEGAAPSGSGVRNLGGVAEFAVAVTGEYPKNDGDTYTDQEAFTDPNYSPLEIKGVPVDEEDPAKGVKAVAKVKGYGEETESDLSGLTIDMHAYGTYIIKMKEIASGYPAVTDDPTEYTLKIKVANNPEASGEPVVTAEISYTDKEGTEQKINISNGELTDGEKKKITLTNEYETGSAVINQHVTGLCAPDESFDVTVTLEVPSKSELPIPAGVYPYVISGATKSSGNITVTVGDGGIPIFSGNVLTLKNNDTVRIYDLPEGYTLKAVQEDGKKDYFVAQSRAYSDSEEPYTETYEQSIAIVKEKTVNIDFTERYMSGGFTVEKEVSGKPEGTDFVGENDEFKITVTFSKGTTEPAVLSASKFTAVNLALSVGRRLGLAPKIGQPISLASDYTPDYSAQYVKISGESKTSGVFGGTITLKEGDKLYIYGIPAGYTYEVSEALNGVSDSRYDLGSVEYTDEKHTITDLNKDSFEEEDYTSAVTVKNEYAPLATGIQSITLKKILSGDITEETNRDYTFSLERTYAKYSAGGTDIAIESLSKTVRVSEKDYTEAVAEIGVELESYSLPGVYEYELKETSADTDTVKVDDSVYTFTVTVEDEDGQLKVKNISVDKSGVKSNVSDADGNVIRAGAVVAEFTNVYTPLQTAPVTLNLTKELRAYNAEGEKLDTPENMFSFTVSAETDDGVILPEVTTFGNKADGSVSITPIVFTKAGRYNITVSENAPVKPSGSFTGNIENADDIHIEIVVEDQNGQLVVTTPGEELSVTAVNIYTPEEVKTSDPGREPEVDPAGASPLIFKTLKDSVSGAVIFDASGIGAGYTGSDVVNSYESGFKFSIAPDAATAADSSAYVLPAQASNELGTVSFGEITFKKDGVYTFVITEAPVADRKITVSNKSLTVKYTVALDRSTGLLSVSEPEYANGRTLENEYTPDSCTLTVGKTVTVSPDSGLIADGEKEFEITVSLKNCHADAVNVEYQTASGEPAAGKQSGSVAVENGGIVISLRNGERAVISGIHIDTVYSVSEKAYDGYSAAYFPAEGSFAKEGESAEATVINSYSVKPVKVTENAENSGLAIKARKAIDGRGFIPGDEFTFALDPSDGVGKTATASDGAPVGFGDIEFTKPGEYSFTLSEGAGSIEGMIYDKSKYEIVYTVVDNKNGGLEVSREVKRLLAVSDGYTEDPSFAAAEGEALVFTNIYDPGVAVSQPVEILKKLVTAEKSTAIDFEEGDFEFTAEFTGETAEYAEFTDGGSKKAVIRNLADGRVIIPSATFKKAGVYTLILTETSSEKSDVSAQKVTVTYTVTDVGGRLEVTSEASVEEIVNIFVPEPVTAEIIAKKMVEDSGTDIVSEYAGKFEFRLEGGSLSAALIQRNGADGLVKFGVPIEKEGEYDFVISEVIPQGAERDANIAYDTSKIEVHISVTAGSDGVLVPTVTYKTETGAAEFTNVYDPVPCVLTVTNTVSGDAIHPEKEFRYTVYLTEANGAPFSGEIPYKSGNGGNVPKAGGTPDGMMMFNDGKAEFVLKHLESVTMWEIDENISYRVVQEPEEGYATGVEANPSQSVSALADGEITEASGVFAYPVSEANISYSNVYSLTNAELELPSIIKYLAGRAFKEGESFTFSVTSDSKSVILPAPAASADSGNEPDESGRFKAVARFVSNAVFTDVTAPGEAITIVIKEEGESGGGISIDETEYTYSVVVSDDGRGHRVIESVAPELPESLTFVNTYEAGSTGLVSETLTKNLTGRINSPELFEFVLTRTSAPDGAEAFADAAIKLEFLPGEKAKTAELSLEDYKLAGRYVYAVSEVAGTNGGIVYDGREYVITVDVVDDGLGNMTAAKSLTADGEEAGGIVFENRVCTGTLTVTNTVTGPGADRELPFGFRVTLGEPINGVYGEMTFTDGIASFELADGGIISAVNLPENISYKVEESLNEGYTVRSYGEEGIVTPDGAIAEFVNYKGEEIPETGSLKVSKTVINGIGGESYNFVVTLSDSIVNGKYGDMVFADGIAFFALSDGESAVAEGLPPADYTVSEVADPDSFDTVSTGESGSIEAGKTAEAHFVNIIKAEESGYMGNLSITKIAPEALAGERFGFRVTLSDTGINGVYGGLEFVNGTAVLTLADSETVTVPLPAGISYKVEETAADGYVSLPSGDIGVIPENGTASAVFINDRIIPSAPLGDLSVEKLVTVDGAAVYTGESFNFKAVLDIPLNGVYGDMFFTDGVAVFSLASGQTLTAKGLPAGTSYTVTEETSSGVYKVNAVNSFGFITAGSTVKATFVNVASSPVPSEPEDPRGNLEITKLVSGGELPLGARFGFTVTLDSPISGVFGGAEFSGGIANITLGASESVIISGLPAGVHYLVEENALSSAGFTVTSSGASGTISEGTTVYALFENTAVPNPVGSLTVTKVLSGTAAEYERGFTFRVTLNDGGITGRFGEMDFVSGEAVFTLRGGESVKAEGLPAGVGYHVSEEGADDCIKTFIRCDGIISAGVNTAAAVVNLKDAPYIPNGALAITKIVEGAGTDPDKTFKILIKLDDAEVNGLFGDVFFESGEAEITIRDGETVVASGIVAGTGYTVTESDSGGYISSVDGGSGIIADNAVSEVTVTNTKPAVKVSLTISKSVAAGGEMYRDFSFAIFLRDLTGAPLSGSYGYSGTKNGLVADGSIITLRHGDTITIEGLPEGTAYTVTELTVQGYTVGEYNTSGVIYEGNAEAVFVNYPIPQPYPPAPVYPEIPDIPDVPDVDEPEPPEEIPQEEEPIEELPQEPEIPIEEPVTQPTVTPEEPEPDDKREGEPDPDINPPTGLKLRTLSYLSAAALAVFMTSSRRRRRR